MLDTIILSNPKDRGGKSTEIIYLRWSTDTCVKKDPSKSKTTAK